MLRDTLLLTLILVLLAPLALAHDNAKHDTTATGRTLEGVTNPLCPVTTDEPVDPAIFVEYEGQQVFFCCKRCRVKFLESPGDYVANIPQLAAASVSEEPGHEGHSHDTDQQKAAGTVSRLVRFAGKFHPLAVHFPIALLISALVAVGLGTLWQGPRFIEATRVLVLFGVPMAALAAALGWAAGANAGYPGELATVLTRHRWLGTATAGGALATLFISERSWRHPTARGRALFLAALVGTAALVGLTGHFGGTLIHGLEHFRW